MSDLGLQSYFVAPSPGVPVADDSPVQDRPVRHEGVQLSLDWLSISLHPAPDLAFDVDQVQVAASLLMGCEPGDWTEREVGSYGYQKGMLGPVGAQIWWDAPGRNDIHVSLPGQACQVAGANRLKNFMRYAMVHGGKASRCDVNLDDYDRLVEPDQVLAELQGRNSVTHAQKWMYQRGGAVGDHAASGVTVYLGSPTSRQRLRVYDKGLESGGEMDCIRWELQCRAEAAETMVLALIDQDWATVIRSRLGGFIDFRDADSHSEVEKRVRLPWWSRLLAGVAKARAYPPKAIRTVDQVVQWVDDAMGPSLALVVSAFGGDLGRLWSIIERGRARWKPRHHAMLAGAGAG